MEILFRGKHKNPYVDKWVQGYYALEDGEHVIIVPHSTSYEQALKENRPIPPISVKHTIDYNTLGQYTGLKDKNGNKIFAGDIVLYEDWEMATENGSGDSFINKGIVIYNEHNCNFDVTEKITVDVFDVL